jgi:hypothetical protein
MAFDTSPAMTEAQIPLYRKIGPAGRGRIAAEMSDMLRELAIAGVRLRHPEYNEEQVLAEVLTIFMATDLTDAPRRAEREAIFSTLSELDRTLLHLCPSVRAEQIL